jgi:hypothetical protein
MTAAIEFSDKIRMRTKCKSTIVRAEILVAALHEVDTQFPGFWGDIYNESKQSIRNGVRLVVNNVVVFNLDTPLPDGSVVLVHFVPSGG